MIENTAHIGQFKQEFKSSSLIGATWPVRQKAIDYRTIFDLKGKWHDDYHDNDYDYDVCVHFNIFNIFQMHFLDCLNITLFLF